MNGPPLAETPTRVAPPAWRDALRADVRDYWPLWLLVAAAILLRLYEVHRLPGMQGDEAWYGLQARMWLGGEQIEWRTPTGNVPGLIHLWSLVLLHALFEPSLLLLRLPAVLSSVAAMMLAYSLGRRFFGPGTAMMALVLMACFPIAIAYARLGWDPSHSPVLVLAACYAAFAGRKLLCALLFALAIFNHPSSVFIAPFLTLGFSGFEAARHGAKAAFRPAVALGALLLLAIVMAMVASPSTTQYLSLSRTLARLIDPGAWLGFAQMFARLLSGDTVYAYVFGRGFAAARAWADWATVIALVAVILGGGAALRKRWDWRTAGLLAGWLASLALLYLVAGLWVLSPKLERFALAIVPLTALTAGVVSARLIASPQALQLLAAVLGLPMLAGFWLCYVMPLNTGSAPPTRGFWTGQQDPALSVYQRVAGHAATLGGALVIAEDWWLHLPLAYYAAGSSIDVVDAADGQSAVGARPVYWVVYAGSELDRKLALRSSGGRPEVVPTSSKGNVIHIWQGPADPGLR